MKKFAIISFVLVIGLCLGANSIAADRGAIEKAVAAVSKQMCAPGGSAEGACKANQPPAGLYVFIMKKSDGMLVVHPTLSGKSLKADKYKVIYDQLIKATSDGKWVQYMWKGNQKNTYAILTDTDYIVGCGY